MALQRTGKTTLDLKTYMTNDTAKTGKTTLNLKM